MGNGNAKFSIVIFAIMQLLFAATVFADPAPSITSFDIVQVCVGNDTSVIQCVDTSSSPFYVSIPRMNGTKLYVYTQQNGYASSLAATFVGATVHSISTSFIYNPYPVVGGFIDQWDCGAIKSGTFRATAVSVNTYREWVATTYISINPVLSVTKLGTGSGDVAPDTGTLSWSGNAGIGNYVANTSVTLMPTASAGSTFDGWSGACTNTSGDCAITMDADKSVSATFTVIPNSRIGSTPYGTLTNAYNAVATGEIIEAKDMTFVENLTLSRDIPFTLRGGYADDYGSRTGFTILNGVLTISSGSMIVDSLIIRP